MDKLFQGVGTALITPFDEDGSIDFDTLGALIDRQVNAGVDAIISCGTTGECATLSVDEFVSVVNFTVNRCEGKIPVIAGTGRNDTEMSLHLSLLAQDSGAAGLLMVNPYYNKTTQKGLIAHYSHIAERVDLPILLYNVPSRTGMSLSAETYRVLAEIPNIAGVKEASGDFSLILKIFATCPADFYVYSGNDDHILPILSLGGQGVISTVSNIAPKEVSAVCDAFFSGKSHLAAMHQAKLEKLISVIFSETNPIPLKAAMAMMDLDSGILRLPLCDIGGEKLPELRRTLADYGLLNNI